MLIFWIIISVLIALFGYFLFIPIRISLFIKFDRQISTVSAIKIYPFRHQFVSRGPEKAKKRKKEEITEVVPDIPKEKRKSGLLLLGLSDYAVIYKALTEALKYAGRLIKAPQYFLRVEFSGGASEPDITGELYGAYHAIRPILPRGISIHYSPDFAAERFEGTLQVGLAVRIFRLLNETLIFIFRLPLIKLIKLYWKLKKGA